MENQDISVSLKNNYRFNFRVAAYFEYNNKVLLHKIDADDFWNLVGGRVKTGETTIQAIKREIKEELNTDIIDAKLILISENFFKFNENNGHEMLFVYKITLDKNSEILKCEEFRGQDRKDATYRWIDKQDIKNHKCLPKLIYELVKENFDHIIHGVEINDVFEKQD